MKQFTIILVFLLSLSLHAQLEIQKSAISNGGGSAVNGNVYVVHTTGEAFIREADVSNTHLSEGFIGPDIAQVIMSVENYEQLTGYHIYPSPVQNDLNIRFDESGNYQINLFDLTGKLIYRNQEDNTDNFRVDMRPYPAGIYLVYMIDLENKKAISIKIQKK